MHFSTNIFPTSNSQGLSFGGVASLWEISLFKTRSWPGAGPNESKFLVQKLVVHPPDLRRRRGKPRWPTRSLRSLPRRRWLGREEATAALRRGYEGGSSGFMRVDGSSWGGWCGHKGGGNRGASGTEGRKQVHGGINVCTDNICLGSETVHLPESQTHLPRWDRTVSRLIEMQSATSATHTTRTTCACARFACVQLAYQESAK